MLPRLHEVSQWKGISYYYYSGTKIIDTSGAMGATAGSETTKPRMSPCPHDFLVRLCDKLEALPR